ncbi:MAG TPA: helix-turn-helix transcriptional regulator [Phenylobacterium sp.]|nr:helix-turn-helix transcriptional regulator [Phenylobacterium sp.]
MRKADHRDGAYSPDTAIPEPLAPRSSHPELPAPLRPLSIRQLEAVLCILAGDSIGETARRLDLSASTVRYHLTRALEVMEVADRGALLALPLMTDLPRAA